jgi:hypothetical protein
VSERFRLDRWFSLHESFSYRCPPAGGHESKERMARKRNRESHMDVLDCINISPVRVRNDDVAAKE